MLILFHWLLLLNHTLEAAGLDSASLLAAEEGTDV